jgi:nucleotide-binding universal stress UspA family protein
MMIKTILVPTDGSDHAVKAIAIASDIASKYDARVILFHALLAGISGGEILNLIESNQLSEQCRDDLQQTARLQASIKSTAMFGSGDLSPSPDILEHIGRDLLDAGETVVRQHGVKNVSQILTNGEPIDCILRAIDDEEIDMIVMGSRGLGTLDGLLIGSMSHKLGHLADCTVVTVK